MLLSGRKKNSSLQYRFDYQLQSYFGILY